MTGRKNERSTPQRRVILEELQKVQTHPTAAEVYELVRKRLPKISLGTVYRNLERLAAAGRIQKLALAGAEARFDGDLDPHYHVRCVRCGRVNDVHGVPRGLFEDLLEDSAGYEMLGHRLEFVGVCPGCKSGGVPGECGSGGDFQKSGGDGRGRSATGGGTWTTLDQQKE